MRRRRALALASGAFAGLSAAAQTRSGARRIGVLSIHRFDSLSSLAHLRDAFWGRLRELGWVDGRTLEVHPRWAEGRPELLPELARELVALELEVIVTIGSAPTAAASAATRTIPIVMVDASGPVEAGWIRSLARPGGNVTGTAAVAGDLAGKQVELLHLLVPQGRRIAMLVNGANAETPSRVANAVAAGKALAIEVTPFAVARIEDFAPTLARIGEARPDAMLVAVESLLLANRATVIEFAQRTRLPALYSFAGLAHDGALISFSSATLPFFVRSAEYVDKILRGANPAELPVEQPTQFTLEVSLAAARAIGLEVPRAILDRADEIIE